VQNKNQIGLNIADITILLSLPYSKEKFILKKDFLSFFVNPTSFNKPEVNIQIYYNKTPPIFHKKRSIVEAGSWLRAFSSSKRKKFLYMIDAFQEKTLIKGIFKRRFEYKKISFNLEILLNIDRFNLGIAKKLLPLPYRVAIFNGNFKTGYIYVKEKRDRAILPFPLEPPFLEILLINLLVLSESGMILHSSGIVDDGKAYLFIGGPGAGKSTMAELWRQAGGKMLQDEKIIVRKNKGSFLAFSIPGYGGTNLKPAFKGIKIEKIFFIYHSQKNEIKQLNSSGATYHLLRNGSGALFYLGIDSLDWYIRFCKELALRIPCYSLGFVPDRKVIDFIREIK